MTLFRRLALVVLVLAAGAFRASAQTCNTGRADNIVFNVVPAAVTFPTPTAADFNNGFSQSATYTLTIKPSKNWTWYLCVQAVSANWGTVNGFTKPVSDLQLSVNGGAWTPLSAALAQLLTGTGTKTVTIAARAALSWANDRPLATGAPGTYGPLMFNLQVAQ